MISPTKTKWPSQRKLTAIYAVAIGLLVANVHFTVWNLLAITVDSKRVYASYDLEGGLGDLRAALLRAENAHVEFLLTGDDQDLAHAGADVEKSIRWVAGHIGDVTARQSHFLAVRDAASSRMAEREEEVRARKAKGAAATDVDRSHGTMKEVDRGIDAMEADEHELRKKLRSDLNDSFRGTIFAFSAVSMLDLILLLGFQYLSSRSRRELALNAEWFSTTLRSIGDAVIATDAEGRISFMNKIAEGLTGWSEAEARDLPLERAFVVIDEKSREPSINPVGRVLATGTIQDLVGHAILVAKDGTERPIDDSAAPIKDQAGTIRGVVMVFRDVTRDKAAGAERERLYQELRERDRRKDEFLAMLGHELRNPLAAIGNAVTVGSMTHMHDHHDWALDVIRRQMHHLSRIIDDLLDVSRISRGKIELKIARTDVSGVVTNAVESVRPLIEEKNHTLDVSLEPDGLWADADPTRLEQAIVNLLNNAAKYTERGGRIGVVGRIEDGSVKVVVSDTGVGIPPEKLPEMFELFAQGDRSLARSEGGLGIGLTVVKKLVEMHGGSITARSGGGGRGSEFTLSIPATEPPATSVTSRRDDRISTEISRVLVVDDNVDTVLGLSKILEVRGHRVETAYSGPEAIETAQRTRPEYILLDIGLPGMDGYEVAKRLRREECGREAVLIAITGYGREADRNRAKESGFDHHLVKPLDHDALVTLLTKN